MHPFRFGLLNERFGAPAQVLSTAVEAEQAGFATLVMRDHLIDEPFGQYAPWSTLAAVAQATTRLRVGTLVTANDFRHPAVLAKEVTTLDQLSGGRVELGLGDCAALLPASLHRGEMTDSAQERSLDHVKAQVATLREAAGGRFDTLEVCLIATVLCASDRRAAAERLAAQRGWQASADEILAMPGILIGDTNAMAEHLQEVREQVGVSYLVVRDSQLKEALGVVERLSGR